MIADWFPKPALAFDVEAIPPPEDLTSEEMYELLCDPMAVEWRERVGVVGRNDGSAKSVTRLLHSRGWVVKTRADALSEQRAGAVRAVESSRGAEKGAGVWHPSKQWALIRVTEGYYPVSFSRALTTLRQLPSVEARLSAWLRMIRLAVVAYAEHGVGLDLNPSNFGVEPGGSQLYYIDDEIYSELRVSELAGAVVARIPEEPELEPETWRAFGAELASVLEESPGPAIQLARLIEELQRYPLTPSFDSRREALAAGLATSPARASAPKPGARGQDLVCVLADIHANLPALEACLEMAKSLGATRYLVLGDVVGYGPHPKECIARLAELERVSFLKGNHDHAVATGALELGMNGLARTCAEWTISALSRAEREWLGELPLEHTEDGWIGVHGAPRDPKRLFAYVYELTYEENLRHLVEQRVPICFHGHTHVAVVYTELPSGPRRVAPSPSLELDKRRPNLVNPGSVGQPRDGDARAAFALFEPEASRIAFLRTEYDLEHTLRDLRQVGLPETRERRLLDAR